MLFTFQKVITDPEKNLKITLKGMPSRKIKYIKKDFLEEIKPLGKRVIAGMATMPTRLHTFNIAFASLIRLVDHLYLYLDGHEEIPEIAQNHSRVTTILAKELPDLHANGKLIGLTMEKEDCLYVCADDDMYFSSNFIHQMNNALLAHQDKAVVGLHGTNLTRPFDQYYKNRTLVSHYAGTLDKTTRVDILGTGAVIFNTAVLSFDVRKWPSGISMADLGLAIEAAKQQIPLYSIARKCSSVLTIESEQEDSLYVARKKNDSLQTKLAHELIRQKESGAADVILQG